MRIKWNHVADTLMLLRHNSATLFSTVALMCATALNLQAVISLACTLRMQYYPAVFFLNANLRPVCLPIPFPTTSYVFVLHINAVCLFLWLCGDILPSATETFSGTTSDSLLNRETYCFQLHGFQYCAAFHLRDIFLCKY